MSRRVSSSGKPALDGPAATPPRAWRNTSRVALLTASLLVFVCWPGRLWLADAMHDRAERALNASAPRRALVWLNRANRLVPDSGRSEFLAARAYRKQGQWNLMKHHLQRAAVLGYAHPRVEREQWLALAQSGQLREAEPHFSQMLTDPGDDGAEICAAIVNGYFVNHRSREADRVLDSWIADFPADPEPLLLRGKIRLEARQLKNAEQDLRRALELAPTYAAVCLELGRVLVEEQRFDEALGFYERCEHSPADDESADRAAACIGQAKCWRVLDRLDRAEAALDRIPAESELWEAQFERGELNLQNGQFAAAVAALQRAAQLNPRAISVRQSLARALRKTGATAAARAEQNYVAEAEAALARAEQLSVESGLAPRNAKLRYDAGMLYLKYAVPELGVQWLLGAVEVDPNFTPAHAALADYFESRAGEDGTWSELARTHRAAARAAPSRDHDAP